MTGKDLIKLIEDTGLAHKDIVVNFSYNNNSSFVSDIKEVVVECSDEVVFIDIGKIDNFIQASDDESGKDMFKGLKIIEYTDC